MACHAVTWRGDGLCNMLHLQGLGDRSGRAVVLPWRAEEALAAAGHGGAIRGNSERVIPLAEMCPRSKELRGTVRVA
jgi:hypothetical protein